ncbi:hypothetical protein ABIB25_002728 [Nakamurella sp. UYEF19]|uniref:GH-E family nuclease n=1 Tax=Nakamurella sp. UYEF19 TaxID=1756392 RepID=UPI003391D54D
MFSLTGDADSIRASAGTWSGFSTAASTAAGDIRHIDSGDFKGDEADTYRDKMNGDLPPHLDTTSEAWSKVATALTTYATTLQTLQTRMHTLASTATHQQQQVDSAGNAAADAKAADARHTADQTAAAKKLPAGQTLPPDTYRPQTSGAGTQLNQANAALQSTIDAANQVRAEHNTAVDHCVTAIHQAAGMRFEEPPGFWGKLGNSITGWIKDHADVLKSISSVLKTISGIAGLLAMIPILSPIMGPIALATGAAALGIDVTLKLVTGEGSWTDIGMDVLGVIPGGRAAGEAVKGAEAATDVVRTASTVGKDAGAVKKGANAASELKTGENAAARAKSGENAGTEAKSGQNAATEAKSGDPRQPGAPAKKPVYEPTRTRVKLRAQTKREVYADAERHADGSGDFVCAASGDRIPAARDRNGDLVRIDPVTGRRTPDGMTVPAKGQSNFGHVPGHEWRSYKIEAEANGYNRRRVIEDQNDPGIYRVETPAANQGHQYEQQSAK